MQTVETVQHNGCTIRIHPDTDAEDPRTWDNLGHMVCGHKRRTLGDEQAGQPVFRHVVCKSWDEVRRVIEMHDRIAAILPVYGYDHSCFDLSTKIEPYWWHYSWDGGQVGFIYITAEKAREEFGWKRITPQRKARLEELLAGEVKTYAQWLNGDVYWYSIELPGGEDGDRCGGYYGMDEAIEAAKEACPELVAA